MSAQARKQAHYIVGVESLVVHTYYRRTTYIKGRDRKREEKEAILTSIIALLAKQHYSDRQEEHTWVLTLSTVRGRFLLSRSLP